MTASANCKPFHTQSKGTSVIEVLKQALEALYPISHNSTDDYRGQADKAIASLRQAIREHAMYEVQRLGQEIEQEPVAWMFQHDETGRMTFVESQQLERGWEKENPRYKKIGPVYTHPPQRTWVGLMDEDQFNLVHAMNENDWDAVQMMDAIEAKLKEKNGY